MSQRVGIALRRAVAERAGGTCGYCGMPDDVLRLPHEPDHVVAPQHGGQTALDDLAYTCCRCNRLKGPNLSSIDRETGLIAQLFNPRIDAWREHFRWEGADIVPLTPGGRATIALLRLNDPERISLRSNLMLADRYPFLPH